ncbi:hypothetical protein SynMINOS11_00554 [Synechococcus sp. Minos11]|nr:hypothetical protein SynMINOS11_00554 [Synechococcus sp. Minos11]
MGLQLVATILGLGLDPNHSCRRENRTARPVQLQPQRITVD